MSNPMYFLLSAALQTTRFMLQLIYERTKEKDGMELLNRVRIGEVVPADYARDYKNLEKFGAAR